MKIGIGIGTITAFMAVSSIILVNYNIYPVPSQLLLPVEIFWYSSFTTGILIIIIGMYWLIYGDKTMEQSGHIQITYDKNDKGLDAEDIAKLLPDSEKQIFLIVMDHNGEIRQSDVVAESGMSKAKVSRVLDSLENRGIIVRIRSGMGNIVRVNRK